MLFLLLPVSSPSLPLGGHALLIMKEGIICVWPPALNSHFHPAHSSTLLSGSPPQIVKHSRQKTPSSGLYAPIILLQTENYILHILHIANMKCQYCRTTKQMQGSRTQWWHLFSLEIRCMHEYTHRDIYWCRVKDNTYCKLDFAKTCGWSIETYNDALNNARFSPLLGQITLLQIRNLRSIFALMCCCLIIEASHCHTFGRVNRQALWSIMWFLGILLPRFFAQMSFHYYCTDTRACYLKYKERERRLASFSISFP